MQLAFLVAKALLDGDFASYFASVPSAAVEPEPIVLRQGKFERTSRMEDEERGSVAVAVLVVREVDATAETDAEACERWLRRFGWERHAEDGSWRIVGMDTTAPEFKERRVRAVRVGLRRDVDDGEVGMSDKGKRVNMSGCQAEPTVKRARPFGRDDRAARDSQRRASACGRARGNA